MIMERMKCNVSVRHPVLCAEFRLLLAPAISAAASRFLALERAHDVAPQVDNRIEDKGTDNYPFYLHGRHAPSPAKVAA